MQVGLFDTFQSHLLDPLVLHKFLLLVELQTPIAPSAVAPIIFCRYFASYLFQRSHQNQKRKGQDQMVVGHPLHDPSSSSYRWVQHQKPVVRSILSKVTVLPTHSSYTLLVTPKLVARLDLLDDLHNRLRDVISSLNNVDNFFPLNFLSFIYT